MVQKGRRTRWSATAGLLALLSVGQAATALATGVPIDGFLPMVGITLTNEYIDDLDFFPRPSPFPSGTFLGNAAGHYELALLDTGAAVSLLTTASDTAFNIDGPYPQDGMLDGFRGTEEITIGGATGFLQASISDPLGLYSGGLQNRTASGASLTMNNSELLGQTNSSIITVPPESDLPNVLGLSFVSQYATRIRNSLPQLFELADKTVRSPAIDFHPLGSQGLGITRKAQLSLLGSSPSTPLHFPNLQDFNPEHPNENPSQPTLVQGGHFLNVNVSNNGASFSSQFFFDTGASVTVLSQFKALELGFDVTLDTPEFTIAIVGSAGTIQDIPGFYVDQITIPALGGSLVVNNVPVIVLDVTNVANPGNIVDGIIGTNIFQGRDIVIDPNPSLGGGGPSAGLYISDPVTSDKNWTSALAAGDWATADHWLGSTTPGLLNITNVRHVSGGSQTVTLTGEGEAWEVNVSGGGSDEKQTLEIGSEARLTTFSGTNIESFGGLRLNGGVLDSQYVQVLREGFLGGNGEIRTGSGPIPGQVENVGGHVTPGDDDQFGTLQIEGRFSNGPLGTLAYTLAGVVAGDDYGQLIVDGDAAFAGTLQVLLDPDFTPSVGDSFELATFNSSVGQFSTLELPAGINWDLAYMPNALLLSVVPSLAGDFNGDGVVGTADYVMWRNLYGSTTHPHIDLDQSGTVDDGDYAIWAANFGNVAGGGGTAALVPEPGAAVLSFSVLCWALATRRRLYATHLRR